MSKKLQREIDILRGSLNWIDPMFVDEKTPEAELRQRIKFCLEDARRASPHPSEHHKGKRE